MKKTIKILMGKMTRLQEEKNNTLRGGFASIKGGFNDSFLSTNDGLGCTNSKDCVNTTNTIKCTNTGTCFM